MLSYFMLGHFNWLGCSIGEQLWLKWQSSCWLHGILRSRVNMIAYIQTHALENSYYGSLSSPQEPNVGLFLYFLNTLSQDTSCLSSSQAENLSQMTFKPRNHHFWQAVNSEGITPQNKPGSTNKGTKNKTSKETVIWMGMNFINKTTYFNSLYSSYRVNKFL